MKVYKTLAEDERCEPLRFLPKNLKHIRTDLVSFPGSGNTWARHVIEQASGIYSGSIYEDKTLFSTGLCSVSLVYFKLSIKAGSANQDIEY